MKKIQLVLICLIMCSCQSLRLSNLTNDIINMYIGQNPEERIEDICIVNTEDDEKIVFEIVNYYGGMRHCNDTEYYWGDIKRATYRVLIYGTLNKLFVTARYIIPQERICNFDDFWLWEPTLWRVTINKRDQTVSAYKETPFIDEQDIKVDDLKELVESYLNK